MPTNHDSPTWRAVRATQSLSKEIETYLPAFPSTDPAIFGSELEQMVTSSLPASASAEPSKTSQNSASFTRQQGGSQHSAQQTREPATTAPQWSSAGLLSAIAAKRRRDQELVEALQRRSRVSRRLTGAPIIKGPIIPKESL